MEPSPNSRRLLFSEMYERTQGISPEKVLEGYDYDWDTKSIVSPTSRSVESAKLHTPRSLEDVLRKWKGSEGGFVTGGGRLEIASDLDVLTRAMREHSTVNDIPLYHGSVTTPERTAFSEGRPGTPVPYSEDRHVAYSFAKNPGYGGGPEGRIFRAAPGTLRGLNLIQFGVDNTTVGRGHRREREWLIDPTSFQRP